MGYGAQSYVGRASQRGQLLLPSTVVTATGIGTPVDFLGEFSTAVWQLDLTLAATAAGDTLDVYVQTTIDNVNWLDCVHFTQVLGNGPAKRYITKTFAELAQTEYESGTPLGANSVRHIFGQQYQVRWAVVNNSAPSFTFSVAANLLS